MDAIIGLSIVTREIDDKYGTDYHRRFMDYLKTYQANDVAGTCSQTDMKGDRMKRPSEQADPWQSMLTIHGFFDRSMVLCLILLCIGCTKYTCDSGLFAVNLDTLHVTRGKN